MGAEGGGRRRRRTSGGAGAAAPRVSDVAGSRPGRARRVRTGVYLACAGALLAGCASMPDSGDLRGVESTPRQDPQVRVFALPPRENASPAEIVQGFLEALTSDDPQYETARKYLTGKASHQWRPERSITVLDASPNPEAERTGNRESGDDYAYGLTGRRVARIDAQHKYTSDAGSYAKTIHLVQDKGSKQWRIDALPQGVVMGASDFQRNYESVNKYYFATNGPTTAAGRLSTVADPVYVRKQVDPVTQVIQALLKGPTRWLAPVARSGFPAGVALRPGAGALTPDDQNRLTVPLNKAADRVGSRQCARMAAQLLFTLQDLTPTGVTSVELQKSDGSQLCTLNEDRAQDIASHGTAKRPEFEYFIDDKQRLVRMTAGGTEAEQVPGALGQGTALLRAAAVSRDEKSAAGVSADGRSLYVGSLVPDAPLGEALLRSQGASPDDRLTTPSWDSRGDLWVADRNPQDPRLLLFEKGAGEPVEVATPGLDGRIDAVRVAGDGVRVALIVEKDGKTSLQIGRIEREKAAVGDGGGGGAAGSAAGSAGSGAGSGEAGARAVVSIQELRSLMPQFEAVTAMSWAGDSRLVVVGRESGGVQQIRYVQVDGSTPAGSAPASLTGVKQITASEDERLPLVAYSEDGIVRLSSGAQWQKVIKKGTAPVYPG
ncbi:lipoprotein LpqB [Streptomyces griseoaurantiacus]|nr:lipoprotein LpqB [Streptomyces griseoaurantiacus]